MSAKRVAIGGWLVCVFSVTMLAASAGQSGVRHAPSTCLADGYSTVSGNGLFVRVGGFSSMVLLSPDETGPHAKCLSHGNPTHWACQNSGTPSSLYSITFGAGRFVAVGNEGAIVTSADGIAWKAVTSGTEERLRGAVFAKGMFVAVGYNGAIVTSRDGFTWKTRHSGTDGRLYGVVFGNDRFLAISKNGEVLESLTGKKWNRATRLSGTFTRLEHQNGAFRAIALHGLTFSSVDGLAWSVLAPLPMIASVNVGGRNARSR